jgi:hypothetical protein
MQKDDVNTDGEWRIAAEGLDDLDHAGNRLTLLSLFVTGRSPIDGAQTTIELVAGVVRCCDDQRSLSRIRCNEWLPNDDAAVILLGIFDSMSGLDLVGGFTELPVRAASWLDLLYHDLDHVAWILSRVREIIFRRINPNITKEDP